MTIKISLVPAAAVSARPARNPTHLKSHWDTSGVPLTVSSIAHQGLSHQVLPLPLQLWRAKPFEAGSLLLSMLLMSLPTPNRTYLNVYDALDSLAMFRKEALSWYCLKYCLPLGSEWADHEANISKESSCYTPLNPFLFFFAFRLVHADRG